MSKQTDQLGLSMLGQAMGLPSAMPGMPGMPAMPSLAFDTSSHATAGGGAWGGGGMDGSGWTVNIGAPAAAQPVRFRSNGFGLPVLGNAGVAAGPGQAQASGIGSPRWLLLFTVGFVAATFLLRKG